MKRLNVILLTSLLVVLTCTLLACGKEAEKAPEATAGTPVSAYKSTGSYIDLGEDQLSWEGLEALPKKRTDMTPQEARETVLAFWLYCKKALWIPDAQYDIYKEENGQTVWKRAVEAGKVYAGLPYVSSATGSLYRLLDFMDPDTGVVNVTEVGQYPLNFGGMCSSGCYWAWSRVMNSADYRWCADSVVARGYLRVGPYTYPDSWHKFEEEGFQGTDDVCQDKGEQVMYQSYAAMQVADGGITLWEKNGHTNMCSVAPTVVYNADGTINGDESWLCIIEQGAIWEEAVSEGGISYTYERSIERKFTFKQLYEGAYLPYTFGELIGTDPIEETEVSFSYSEETITEKQLFSAKVTSNYNISDVYVLVYDASGTEVLKHVVRARTPSTREMRIQNRVGECYTWGSWDDLSPTGSYTVKIEVQLGTGERPTVYEGKLAFES